MTEDRSASKAQRITAIQIAAAEFFRDKPPWMKGIYVALRRYVYIAVPVLVWCVVLLFEGVLPEALVLGLTLAIAVVLFVLSIPVGLVNRLDLLLLEVNSYTGDSKSLALIVVLLYVLLNFVVIGAVSGFVRGLVRR